MAKINLLPWRAERRKQRQKDFYSMLGLAALAGVLISFLIISFYNGRISNQNSRNQFLRDEIVKVDAQITEINELDNKKSRLLARKEVIEQLQEGDILTLTGRSQSNARVSTYMRTLEGSGWMTRPDLNIIEAKEGNPGLPYEFNLKVKLANPNAPKDGEGAPASATPVAGATTP